MRITIETRAARRATDPARFADALDRAVEMAAQQVKRFIAVYPPKPPRSTYVRTGALGRSWQVEPAGLYTRTIGNQMGYAPEVQGDEQKLFHRRTGWRTTAQAVETQSSKVRNIIAREIGAWLQAGGN